ncbi:MAG: alpha/beta hydrolase [Halieaceae bacterium]|nr:alpha/beta hydrolase [Halieaceae bacterium]
MTPDAGTPAPPKRSLMLLEARAALDAARMLAPLAASSLGRTPEPADTLVIVAPGFGSGDRYTLPLRRYLKRKGFRAEGWGLGTNLAGTNLEHTQDDLSERWDFSRRDDYRGEAGVPFLVDHFYERVLERHRETGMKISLIGWSLGGYMAREVARDLPDIVERVITMGSPTVGGPKYTAAAPFFDKSGMDLDWIEDEIARRESQPISQPITAIVSKTDAIVDWNAAIDRYSPNVQHIEVDAAHLGMGFNPEIWSHVLEAMNSAR